MRNINPAGRDKHSAVNGNASRNRNTEDLEAHLSNVAARPHGTQHHKVTNQSCKSHDHVAMGTDNVYATVEGMRATGVEFQDTIGTYFDLIDKRLPGHGEDVAALRRLGILIDGAAHLDAPQELLLQIFTKEVVGPIFFELIQRKGNEGFGEGNFKALFESIELDQIRRGVLTV